MLLLSIVLGIVKLYYDIMGSVILFRLSYLLSIYHMGIMKISLFFSTFSIFYINYFYYILLLLK